VRRAGKKAWLVSLLSAVACVGTALAIVGAGVISSDGSSSSAGRAGTGVITLGPDGLPLASPRLALRPGGPPQSLGLAVNRASGAGALGRRALAAMAAPMPIGPAGNPPAKTTEVNVQAFLGTQLSSLAWSTESSSVPSDLKAVAAIDNSHVWAAGNNCTLLFSGNGTTWTKDTNVPAGCTANLTGVDVVGSGPGWAVGSGGTVLVCATNCNTATATWAALKPGSVTGKNDGKLTNGSSTAQSASLFATDYSGYAITDSLSKIPASTTVSSATVGTKTATLNHAATGTTSTDIFTVTAPASALPSTSLNFTAVWAADASHVYAVGTTTGGAAAIWSCSAGCGTNAVAIGSAIWTNVTPAGLSSTALNAVEGQGSGLVFAAGSNGKVLVCTASCNTSSAGWNALAAGTGGTVPASAVTFNGVWAVDGTHVYAVGNSGSNGVIWSCSDNCNSATTGPAQVPSPPAVGAGSASGKSAWAAITPVANAPVSPFNTPPALYSVTGSGTNDAWAVGAGGAIFYCSANCTTEPTAWVKLSPSFPTSNTLYGVTAADANHVWAVGAAGTIAAALSPSSVANGTGNAIGELGIALNPFVWSQTKLEGNHVDTTLYGQFFDHTKNAVADVKGLGPLPAWAVTQMTYLDYAARLVAATAVDENSCNPQNVKELTAAENELTNGDNEFNAGHYDAAVDHYKKAWEHAQNAKGSPCVGPGITVDPTGEPIFTVADMVPLDTVTSPPVTVTTTGTAASQVALYEINVTGQLLPALNLQIVEDGTTTIYNGPLNSGWTAASPLNLGAWAAGEFHSFVFTVTFPSHGAADNAYQGKSASLNFVWARS
jgi:hypothetical protein